MEQLKEANNAEKENSAAIEKDRDELALKQEAILEYMNKNNVAPPLGLVAASKDKKSTSLLDDYKGKIAKFKEEIEKKNADLLANKKKISELETKLKRDEHVLKKAVEEVARSKRTRGSSFSSPSK